MTATPYAVLAIVFRKKILVVMDEFEEYTLPEIKIRSDDHTTKPAMQLAEELGVEVEFDSIPGIVSEKGNALHRILNIIRLKAKRSKLEGSHDAKWVSMKKLTGVNELSEQIIKNLILNVNATYYSCELDENKVKSFEPLT